jgi:hypothetical protein
VPAAPAPTAEADRRERGRRGFEMHVRIVEYDRPRLVARETEGAVLSIGIRLEFTPVDGGTEVAARWHVEPKGWMRGMGLVVERPFRKQLDQREAQIARGLAKRVTQPTERRGELPR